MTARALFVTHQCSGTGAPILLLSIMKYLREVGILASIDVYAILGGELIDEFKAFDRFSLNPTYSHERLLADGFLENPYDIVYFNTVETAHLISEFCKIGLINSETKVVSHIHELDGTIKKAGVSSLAPIKARADDIICVSNAVKDNLARYDFPTAKIKVVYPFLERTVEYKSPKLRSRRPFTVLGCGEVTVGKGVDVFLQVARLVAKSAVDEIKFVWVGPDSNKIQQYFEEDLLKLGLRDVVSFAGYKQDVWPFFYDANMFFLSSRQDSFPLVCLEASSSGLPVMYFPESGGIKELLGSKGGIPVAYLDVEESARIILSICCDEIFLDNVAAHALDSYSKKCDPITSLQSIAKTLVGKHGR